VIEATGLCMRYGHFAALEEATFQARAGEVVGLLGPNGAGKTTTMRILTTYLVPTEGRATVAGFDVVAQPLEVRRRIGYLPEQLPLYTALEVQECLRFVGRARGLSAGVLRDRIDWVVEACGIASVFHRPVLQLSKGFKQRTALAQALLHDPEVVILDEPTTGLDPHQIVEIRALVRELGKSKTVILSTHILQEASALADRLIVMSAGRLVAQGTVPELFRHASLRTHVRVGFASDTPGAADAIAGLPGAGDVARVGDGRILDVLETADGLAPRIGALAASRGWTLTELARREPSLESLFLALTQRSGGHLHAPPPGSGPGSGPGGGPGGGAGNGAERGAQGGSQGVAA
jgi:ABC-2 type transport system ATP-binding protein